MIEKSQIYAQTSQNIRSLCDGETDTIAIMATITCELFQAFEAFHWVGFYRNVGQNMLKIGPYQGTHGCLAIPFNKGVCGACATLLATQIVDDVNAIDNHIACSPTTQSEIVLPVIVNNKLFAVLDIDSDNPGTFDKTDQKQLEQILASTFA